MKWIVICLAILSATAARSDHFYSGEVATVADGDTFSMIADNIKVRVRLCGVDSPERGQRGYGQAAGTLATMIEGKKVRCIQVGGGTPCDGRSKVMNRDRIVAQCFIDDKDIGMEMVCAQQAIDLPKFSNGYYSSCKRK